MICSVTCLTDCSLSVVHRQRLSSSVRSSIDNAPPRSLSSSTHLGSRAKQRQKQIEKQCQIMNENLTLAMKIQQITDQNNMNLSHPSMYSAPANTNRIEKESQICLKNEKLVKRLNQVRPTINVKKLNHDAKQNEIYAKQILKSAQPPSINHESNQKHSVKLITQSKLNLSSGLNSASSQDNQSVLHSSTHFMSSSSIQPVNNQFSTSTNRSSSSFIVKPRRSKFIIRPISAVTVSELTQHNPNTAKQLIPSIHLRSQSAIISLQPNSYSTASSTTTLIPTASSSSLTSSNKSILIIRKKLPSSFLAPPSLDRSSVRMKTKFLIQQPLLQSTSLPSAENPIPSVSSFPLQLYAGPASVSGYPSLLTVQEFIQPWRLHLHVQSTISAADTPSSTSYHLSLPFASLRNSLSTSSHLFQPDQRLDLVRFLSTCLVFVLDVNQQNQQLAIELPNNNQPH